MEIASQNKFRVVGIKKLNNEYLFIKDCDTKEDAFHCAQSKANDDIFTEVYDEHGNKMFEAGTL